MLVLAIIFSGETMKINLNALEEVKAKITSLKGNAIKLKINRGRNKIDSFEAIIVSVYPSVFTVKVNEEKQLPSQTFSYYDVLCGDVIIG